MALPESCFIVHGHFYQPPRENPWTEEVPLEPSAEPFHDWNARIAAECYRPNGYARVLDDAGRVVDIVNNYAHLSFNVGPTLLSWMERHAPDAYDRILAGDRSGGGAMAQAYGHLILPLANERDVRTQVRWGLADFAHRFGRPATGMWLPECAVNDAVLAVLVEEGVGYTILAPDQAAEPVDTTRPHRWVHPDGERSLWIVFYDGALSHDVAFGLTALTSEALIDRVAAGCGVTALAADGETFGHHHRWGDRLLAYALAVDAPARGITVATLNDLLGAPLDDVDPTAVRVRESAWSCAHGVDRWRDDCGCSTGGEPGWDQRWRAPLRRALDLLRDHAAEVFERRGGEVLVDPWVARDAYIDVLLGRTTIDAFAGEHVRGDRIVALVLLESQRHAMSMYTSCGWFFNDLAGIETQQVLRYAARVIDLLAEVGEDTGESAFLDALSQAESNIAAEGSGRDVWHRHVAPSRVDENRAVAHLALLDLLERRLPSGTVGGFEVEVVDHERAERGPLRLTTGTVELAHRRTGRRHRMAFSGLLLGGLEVVGAVRPLDDATAEWPIREAFRRGARVTELLRDLYAGAGSLEFGIEAALPDAAEQLLQSAAGALADRFAAAYDRLFEDYRATLDSLAAAGYPLPFQLRAPGELSLARRLELEVAAQRGSLDPADYAGAIAIARQARDGGLTIDAPGARRAVESLLLAATQRAVDGDTAAMDAALTVLEIAADLGFHLDLDRPQELVRAAAERGQVPIGLARLAEAVRVVL